MTTAKRKPLRERTLQGYIEFTGKITCETGLLIGGGDVGLEIGGIDRSVIRDPEDGWPYIPGSSLKGRLRALAEKVHRLPSERDIESGLRHECNDIGAALQCRLCRLFGSTAEGGQEKNNRNLPAALIVPDCRATAAPKIEYKMENTLDRLTAAAVPRLFERVARNTVFPFSLLIRREDVKFTQERPGEPEEVSHNYDEKGLRDDIETLLLALRHLEYQGLGSNISRGYGRVTIKLDKVLIINRWGIEYNKKEYSSVMSLKALMEPDGQRTKTCNELLALVKDDA
jgi:CRISPR-associated protein Csm3